MVSFKHVNLKQSFRSLFQKSYSHRQVYKKKKKKANTFCQKPIKLSCTFSVFLIPSVLISMIFLSKHKLSSLQLFFPLSPIFPRRQNTVHDDTISANSVKLEEFLSGAELPLMPLRLGARQKEQVSPAFCPKM